jgi:hypothetical protein
LKIFFNWALSYNCIETGATFNSLLLFNVYPPWWASLMPKWTGTHHLIMHKLWDWTWLWPCLGTPYFGNVTTLGLNLTHNLNMPNWRHLSRLWAVLEVSRKIMFCKLVAYTKKQLGQGFMNHGTLLAWLEFYACHKGKCNPPP